MADVNSSSAQQNSFEAFSWFNQGAEYYPTARFVSRAHDLSQGLVLVLEMLEGESLHAEGEPQFNATQRGVLKRYAIATAEAINDEARRTMDWINQFGVPQPQSAA